MRHCLALCGAAALFLSPVLGESLRGQEQQPPLAAGSMFVPPAQTRRGRNWQ